MKSLTRSGFLALCVCLTLSIVTRPVALAFTPADHEGIEGRITHTKEDSQKHSRGETHSHAADESRAKAEAKAKAEEERQAKLNEIERNKAEVHKHVRELQIQETQALFTLHKTIKELNNTQANLQHSQTDLSKTKNKIQQTANQIVQTKSQEEMMSDDAGRRLREIYEGQRIGLVEMVFEVSSLQTLLDLFYFQQRIAEMDRELISHLRERAAQLAQKKDQLGSKKNILGDLISQIAEKAAQLGQRKTTQEQVAERLRSERAYWEQAEHQLEIESHQLENRIVDMCALQDGKLAKGSGTFSYPLHAPITSPFGYRTHPIFKVRKFHTGIDLAGANHSEIRAADSGTAIFTGYYGGYGQVVIISHGKGMSTLYAHLSRIAVHQGQAISKGEVIAYEGTTGFSTGPHLHFEVRKDGKPNNPLNYVH